MGAVNGSRILVLGIAYKKNVDDRRESPSMELMELLEAHGRWDWGRRFPVVRLSFAEGVLQSREQLDRRIEDLLRINREALSVAVHPPLDLAGAFGELIRRTHAHYGERVVVLVDEYDKPILDNLSHPDTARELRDGLASLELDLTPEESSNAGRLDLALRFNGQVYLFAFKVVELAPEGRALAQIEARGYAERYRASGQPVYLIGAEFSREQRSVVECEVERLG
jgi:hypothetical protein